MAQRSRHDSPKPEQALRSILVAALGGEGGGVLANWLVSCAQQAGLAVQATSVPGVAQRTGATSYYIEFLTQPTKSLQPVFALSPMPAQVDVVVASELLEAARMMERGFVTPDKTCLIASTSRVYTTLEKMQMGDGRFDSQRMLDLAKTMAQRAVLFDMAALTQAHQTVVSAVMFGALAGAGVLPWSRELCEQVISASGKGVAASLSGFNAAFLKASLSSTAEKPNADAGDDQDLGQPIMSPLWLDRLAELPPSLRKLSSIGVARCIDFQDEAYAQDYLEKLKRLVTSATCQREASLQAVETAARHLALWMCYEDVIRVADLKTRPERFARIRVEAHAQPLDILRVVEHFKPGLDEIAAVLPEKLGKALLAWAQRRRGKPWHLALHIRSSSIWGYLMLRALARLRPWRRMSLRFSQEKVSIELWWESMCALLPKSAAFAEVLAGLPQVLKGYGDTQLRGRLNFERLWQTHVVPALHGGKDWQQAIEQFQLALAASLADPEGTLNKTYRSKPVLWLKQDESVSGKTA